MSTPHFLEHLTDSDLQLLGAVAAAGPEELARLRSDPAGLEELLRRPAVFEALFGGREESEAMLRASPFLAFAVLVHRAAEDLQQATFVEEWLGPRRSVPIFDVSGLREFMEAPSRRLSLAELLASYTHVASGSVWFRTPRGWRRRRYSELDPLRLASMLEVVPASEQPYIYRRLGDLCLFLSGVFPEHVVARPLAPRHLDRLSRALGGDPPDELVLAGGGGIVQFEWLGRRAYQRAATGVRSPWWQRTAQELAASFGRARRILNFITGRYLFPTRQRWFGQPE
ncbi:MAG TPA: hypothetical protein VKY90_02685 [Candidatus Dormibacteraeota bacterium]|nr:hypothetical protein [Candidatus Dormibacteraeota bacterium]